MPLVLATDLDGTLFYPKKRVRMITPKSLDFIRRFIDKGNRLVLVSGRNVESCMKVKRRIGRDVDIVGCNSSFIIKGDKMIKESYFDNEDITRIFKEIRETYKPVSVMIMTADKNYFPQDAMSFWYRFGYRMWYFFQGVYREKFYWNDQKYREAFKSGKIYKIMIMFGVSKKQVEKAKEINKELREKYAGHLESSWSVQAIELTPPQCSKAEGLKYYADYLKINRDDIYVVGDSGNDISMFKEFHKNSFCMSKSSLSVSKHARHVIKHFWEVENYIDERK